MTRDDGRAEEGGEWDRLLLLFLFRASLSSLQIKNAMQLSVVLLFNTVTQGVL